MLLSHPSAEVIQERTLLAFSIVSAVVKVLDTTTTGTRHRAQRAKGTGHRAQGTPQRAHSTRNVGHVVRIVRTEVHVKTQKSRMAIHVLRRVRKCRFISVGCVMIGVMEI